jgi:hypothetical protein
MMVNAGWSLEVLREYAKLQCDLEVAAIPAALFPHYWRGVLKNCFVHSYALTRRTG